MMRDIQNSLCKQICLLAKSTLPLVPIPTQMNLFSVLVQIGALICMHIYSIVYHADFHVQIDIYNFDYVVSFQ